jgi:uncharacterized protein
MTVRIEKSFETKHPIDVAWEVLSDPRKFVSCVPGAQITEAIDDRNFKGSIRVKVGPSVIQFKGEVHIERLDKQAHEIEMSGRGQDMFGKGNASMKMTGALTALAEAGTQVHAVSEVTVVGILAQFGARMMNDVSEVIFKEFATRFQRLLDAPDEAQSPAESVNAVKLAGSALGHSIRRVFGKDDGKSE